MKAPEQLIEWTLSKDCFVKQPFPSQELTFVLSVVQSTGNCVLKDAYDITPLD